MTNLMKIFLFILSRIFQEFNFNFFIDFSTHSHVRDVRASEGHPNIQIH